VHSVSKPRTGARVYAHQDYEENNETDEDEIGHEPRYSSGGSRVGPDRQGGYRHEHDGYLHPAIDCHFTLSGKARALLLKLLGMKKRLDEVDAEQNGNA
jgi:hypothetical protein